MLGTGRVQLRTRSASVEVVLIPAIGRPVGFAKVMEPTRKSLRAFSDRRHRHLPRACVRWSDTTAPPAQRVDGDHKFGVLSLATRLELVRPSGGAHCLLTVKSKLTQLPQFRPLGANERGRRGFVRGPQSSAEPRMKKAPAWLLSSEQFANICYHFATQFGSTAQYERVSNSRILQKTGVASI